MDNTILYRDISLPSAVKAGVEMAKETRVVCDHSWSKAENLECDVCSKCGVYSAMSVIKIPLYHDIKLAEEMVAYSHQYAFAYNTGVDIATEHLSFAVASTSMDCEKWQKSKNIDEFFPSKDNIGPFMPTTKDIWKELTKLRNTDERFKGKVDVQRSGIAAGLNAVIASHDSYSSAMNRVFRTKQENREITEHNKKLIADYEKSVAATPTDKPKKPKLKDLHKNRRSDIRTMETDILDSSRLHKTRKEREKRPIVIPILEKAKHNREKNTFKLEGIKQHLEAKRKIPEELDIRSGTVVETTKYITKRTNTKDRTFALHLAVRHLIPDPTNTATASIGIDIGIVIAIATSDGQKIKLPEELHQMRREIKKWQKLKAKRRKHSRGWSEAKNKIAEISRILAAKKKQFITEQANEHCQKYNLIGLENLNNKGMRTSAQGTKRKPGKNVSAKRGLNRELAFLSPGMVASIYKRAAIKTGTKIILVNAKDTSIECPACGYIAKENRESQDFFRCKADDCCHSGNADINAAINILARAVAIAAEQRIVSDAIKMSDGDVGASSSGTGISPLQPAAGQFSETGGRKPTSIEPHRESQYL